MNNRLFISIMTIFVAAILAVIIIPSASGFGFAPHGPSPAVNARKSSRHLLQYRRTMDHDIDLPILTPLANGNVAAADETIEQSAMDEYLEYIDKRYGHAASSPLSLALTSYEVAPPFKALGLSRMGMAWAQVVHRLRKLCAAAQASLLILVRTSINALAFSSLLCLVTSGRITTMTLIVKHVSRYLRPSIVFWLLLCQAISSAYS